MRTSWIGSGWRVAALAVALVLGTAMSARAEQTIDVLGGELSVYGAPHGELQDGKAHLWFDSKWEFSVAGNTLAHGRGRVFDVEVDPNGGEIKEQKCLNGLCYIIDGEMRRNRLHAEVRLIFRYRGHRLELPVIELEGSLAEPHLTMGDGP